MVVTRALTVSKPRRHSRILILLEDKNLRKVGKSEGSRAEVSKGNGQQDEGVFVRLRQRE